MSVWGPGPFDNDEAADFLSDLADLTLDDQSFTAALDAGLSDESSLVSYAAAGLVTAGVVGVDYSDYDDHSADLGLGSHGMDLSDVSDDLFVGVVSKAIDVYVKLLDDEEFLSFFDTETSPVIRVAALLELTEDQF